jgi:hypothetical protein
VSSFDRNKDGEPLCRFCSREATHRCTSVFSLGMYVCPRHLCPECRPRPSMSEEPEEEQHEAEQGGADDSDRSGSDEDS